MKKKIIVIAAFSVLILITAIIFTSWIMQALGFDMYSNDEFDIGEGFFGLILTVFGGMVIFYELDLFYTVYYFLIKPKTKIKSILNILSNLSLLLAIICDCFPIFFIGPIAYEYILGALFLTYVILRIVYLIVSIILKIKAHRGYFNG